MNISLLNHMFLEELRDWRTAQIELQEVLPDMARAVTFEGLAYMIEKKEARIAAQLQHTKSIFEWLEASEQDGHCPGMQGIIVAIQALLSRRTTLAADAQDSRFIAILHQASHLQIAALQSLLGRVQLLQAMQIQKLLENFLFEELASAECIGSMAFAALRIETAEAEWEIEAANRSLGIVA